MKIAFVVPVMTSRAAGTSATPKARQANRLNSPVSVLSGFIKHHFDAEVAQYYLQPFLWPGSQTVRMEMFKESFSVFQFLYHGSGPISAEVSKLVDELAVQEAELFCFSFAALAEAEDELSYSGRDDEELFGSINLAYCLAHELKRRFPRSTIAVGGLPFFRSTAAHRDLYLDMLTRCRDIDFAGLGDGEEILYHLVHALWQGRDPLDNLPESLTFHRCGSGGLIEVRTSVSTGSRRARPDCRDRSARRAITAPYFSPKALAQFRVLGRDCWSSPLLDDALRQRVEALLNVDFTVLPVKLMSGCGQRCAFCVGFSHPIVRGEPAAAADIVQCLVETSGCRHFMFVDATINASRAYVDAFLDALIERDLDIQWGDYVSLRGLDGALVDKLSRAGMIFASVGVEQPDDARLRFLHKNLTVSQIEQGLKNLHEAGIFTLVNLIVGLPHEDEEVLRKMEAWIDATAPLVGQFSLQEFTLTHPSPFTISPERYGIVVHSTERRGRCDGLTFDEVNGLAWRDKKQATREAYHRIQQRIAAQILPQTSAIDESYVTLQYLYRLFGRENKSRILREIDPQTGPLDARRFADPVPRGLTRAVRDALTSAVFATELNQQGCVFASTPAGGHDDCSFQMSFLSGAVEVNLSTRKEPDPAAASVSLAGISCWWQPPATGHQADLLGQSLTTHRALAKQAEQLHLSLSATGKPRHWGGASLEVCAGPRRTSLHICPVDTEEKFIKTGRCWGVYLDAPPPGSKAFEPGYLDHFVSTVLTLVEAHCRPVQIIWAELAPRFLERVRYADQPG